jgi:hypothetical protein
LVVYYVLGSKQCILFLAVYSVLGSKQCILFLAVYSVLGSQDIISMPPGFSNVYVIYSVLGCV